MNDRLRARLQSLLDELNRAIRDDSYDNPFFSPDYTFDIEALEELLK